ELERTLVPFHHSPSARQPDPPEPRPVLVVIVDDDLDPLVRLDVRQAPEPASAKQIGTTCGRPSAPTVASRATRASSTLTEAGPPPPSARRRAAPSPSPAAESSPARRRRHRPAGAGAPPAGRAPARGRAPHRLPRPVRSEP